MQVVIRDSQTGRSFTAAVKDRSSKVSGEILNPYIFDPDASEHHHRLQVKHFTDKVNYRKPVFGGANKIAREEGRRRLRLAKQNARFEGQTILRTS